MGIQHEEHLHIDRTELDKYKQTLSLIKRTFEAHETALALLNPMHDEFKRRLGSMCTAPMADVQKPTAKNIVTQAFILAKTTQAALEESKIDYLLVRHRLERLEGEVSSLEAKMVERMKAWSVKCHYEIKLTKLRRNDHSAGSEKMDRNLGKMSNADNQWTELDSMVRGELKRIIDDRFNAIEQVNALHIAHLKKYYGLIVTKLDNPPTDVPLPDASGATRPASPVYEPYRPASPSLDPVPQIKELTPEASVGSAAPMRESDIE